MQQSEFIKSIPHLRDDIKDIGNYNGILSNQDDKWRRYYDYEYMLRGSSIAFAGGTSRVIRINTKVSTNKNWEKDYSIDLSTKHNYTNKTVSYFIGLPFGKKTRLFYTSNKNIQSPVYHDLTLIEINDRLLFSDSFDETLFELSLTYDIPIYNVYYFKQKLYDIRFYLSLMKNNR